MIKTYYQIEEEISIKKDLKTVWENVVYFKNSKKWSPWLILDENCKSKIEGKDGELEAIYSWEGEIIGAGEQNHIEINEFKEIKSIVNFIKPFKNIGEVSFKFKETKGEVKVIWTLNSSLPILLFFLKKMIKSMIGRDLQRGLKMLKVLSESGEIKTKTKLEKDIKAGDFYWIGIKNQSAKNEIGKVMGEDFGKIGAILKEKNISPLNILAFYTPKCDNNGTFFEFISSFEILKEDFEKINEEENILKGYYPKTNTLKVTHYGSYDFIDNSWTAAYSALYALKMKKSKSYPFELYKNDPSNTKEEDLITEIYMPIK